MTATDTTTAQSGADASTNTEIDDTTDSPDTRSAWLSTVLAAAGGLSLPLLVIGAAFEGVNFESVPQPWFLLYGFVVLLSFTYGLGREKLKAIRDVMGAINTNQ